MVINHNISSMNAQRNFKINTQNMDNQMQKLSSGLRITKAADDASGLAVSEKMRSQVRGLQMASRNIQDGISFIQTTEGYLQEIGDLLQRSRELSVQAANGIYTDEDRGQIQVEVTQLLDEIDRVASHAQFNGQQLLDGSKFSQDQGSGLVLHVGANMNQSESINIENMHAEQLGVNGLSLSSADSANSAIGTIDDALKTVNQQRADLGAFQNRMEFAMKGVDIGAQNLQAAESAIRDADMAESMSKFIKNQILTQSTSSMLAQANMRSQLVMTVLR